MLTKQIKYVLVICLFSAFLYGCDKTETTKESSTEISYIQIDDKTFSMSCTIKDLLNANLEIINEDNISKTINPYEAGCIDLQDKYGNVYFVEYRNNQNTKTYLEKCEIYSLRLLNDNIEESESINLSGLLYLNNTKYSDVKDISNPLISSMYPSNNKIIYTISNENQNIEITLNFNDNNVLYEFNYVINQQ